MSHVQTPPRRLRAVIIGAGMSGVLAAIRLLEGGRHDVVVYEKADRIGGTWRENTYPGLACDVPAHAYTYSFATNPEWSAFLSPGPEIQRYFERVWREYGVDRVTRFNEAVASCLYRDGRWAIETVNGTRDEADIVIAATGVLHHPYLPHIAGAESFRGASFHSARWDHAVPLAGQRVGIIGNGSTGVQIVSALAGVAARTVHIQRSPQWILNVPNPKYTDAERAAFRANPALIDAIRFGPEYLSGVQRFNAAIVDMNSQEIRDFEAATLQYLEEGVRDPVLREKLRPNYRAACKRLIYSPDYYEKVQRPDVEVVVGGIERIEPEGVRMKDGTLCELDVLVYATGFRADRFVRPMTVRGHDGADLDDFWAKRPTAYLGIAMPGFPNFFMLNGPTGPVGNFSLIEIAEYQWRYIAALIGELEAGHCRALDLKREVMDDYNERRVKAAKNTIFASGCHSWYLDTEGVPLTWPWTHHRFVEETAAPRLEEFERIG
jgi:cation diffusion facilitator CzcD-associated flavoprotein CzcO